MYLQLFNLKEYPFELTPDSDFLFMSKAHARAKAYLDYAIWNRDGFVVITGEIGAGKTTLLQKFLSERDENVVVAKIFQTQLNETEFLQSVLNEFGLKSFGGSKVELMDALNTFLLSKFPHASQVVLIVDEAQNLSDAVLEEIRMLSGLETRKEKILHVVLVGQPELKERIESPEHAQLLQRVRLRFHLGGLSEPEMRSYILHRLRVAGAVNDNIFADNTFPVIYQYTSGIPRLINILCDTSMTCAYADDVQNVTADVVKTAIEELQWQPYAQRVNKRGAAISASVRSEMQSQLRDHTKALMSLSGQINRLDALVPTLTSMSSSMNNIEALLTRIADFLDAQQKQADVAAKRYARQEKKLTYPD
jgi:general secretion pathway protein A